MERRPAGGARGVEGLAEPLPRGGHVSVQSRVQTGRHLLVDDELLADDDPIAALPGRHGRPERQIIDRQGVPFRDPAGDIHQQCGLALAAQAAAGRLGAGEHPVEHDAGLLGVGRRGDVRRLAVAAPGPL